MVGVLDCQDDSAWATGRGRGSYFQRKEVANRAGGEALDDELLRELSETIEMAMFNFQKYNMGDS